MDKAYSVVQLNTWNDYKTFVDELSENWVFRGQAKADWGLQNAIERTDFIRLHKDIEANFLEEFQRGARNYLNRDQIPEHLIEWLALMQHHGAPTRLLDFTKSPFIAAYFAYEISNGKADRFVSVWAINIHFLKMKAIEKLSQHYAEHFKNSPNIINEELFEKIFFDNSCSIVFPVEPFRMNRRYSLQQSLFVSTGNAAEPFMHQLNFLGEDMKQAVIKIEMPACNKSHALRYLQKMNLNRASLFPDLDGYAESLRLRYNSMRTAEEALADQMKKLEDENYPFFP
jgi:hypothetical protein